MNTLAIAEAEQKLQEAQLDGASDKGEYIQREDASGQISYPAPLAAMADAPSMELLQQGLELERQDNARSLWDSCKKDWRVIACCVPYILLACSAGFDQGANNITTSMPGFRIEFGYFDVVNKTLAIESIWISLWPSLLFLGYILGSLACAYLLDRFGPRKVAVAAAIFILGPIVIQALTISKEMLLVGKFLAGIGIGAFQATSGNFTAETSTPKLRSILTSSIGMALILGLVFGIAAGAAVIADIRPWHSWRLVLMLQAVIPIVALILMPFTVTSPIYLIKKDQPAEARRVVKKLTGIQDEQVIAAKVAAMQYAVALEIEERTAIGDVTFWDVLRDRTERRRTLLATGVFVANQAGGTAFLGQGLYFLAQQGIEITIATDITLACLVVSAICYPLSSVISNRFGRRFSFVYMSLLHLVVMAVIGFIGFKKGNVSAGWALAVLVNIGISTQALSTAACCYTLSAEIPSLRLRAKTQSLALTVNNTISLVTTLVVPYIFQDPGYLGAKTALIFAGTFVLAIIWSFFFVPETNRRSPAEIDALFAAGISARKFASTDAQALIATSHGKV